MELIFATKTFFYLEEEGDTAGFLGVTTTRDDKGSIELKQTGLIGRVLEALGLDIKHENRTYTPVKTSPLTEDKDWPRPEGSFCYTSVVGTIIYLLGHSRPDIVYAVNLCARYMFSARLFKRIERHLKATRDKGLVMTPSGTLKVDTFFDADFAGFYAYEIEALWPNVL